MVLNLLEQEGITGRVEGDYLQGGAGELQPLSIVRVVVADEDYAQAKSVVGEWEAVQPRETGDETRVVRSSTGTIKFLLGLAIGVGGMYWVFHSPVTTHGIDYDKDGVLDEKWTYTDSRLTRVEADRNFDGKMDDVYYYDHLGVIDYVESDDDFDGVFETKYQYRHGNPTHQESDLDGDGKIDYRATFQHGILDEVTITKGTSSSPRKRQWFNLNKLVYSEYDANGNGIYEQQRQYDYFEEPK